MKAAIWVLSLASLAGCAAPSMNELRQEEPRQVLHSKKTVKVIADCVQHGWENLSVFEGRSGATQVPLAKGGITVATTGSAYFADIKPDAGGSVAKYYASTYRWISKNIWRRWKAVCKHLPFKCFETLSFLETAETLFALG